VIAFPTNITAGEEYSGGCTVYAYGYVANEDNFHLILPEENCTAHQAHA